MLKYDLNYSQQGQMWQVQHRFALSVLFTTFILGVAFSFKWIRWFFSNKLMRFLSAISFNLYIWHQQLSVHLKGWKIPYWDVESGMPQKEMGKEWQVKYFIICVLASIAAAVIGTYLIEKPMDKLIMKGYNKLYNTKAVQNLKKNIRRLFT